MGLDPERGTNPFILLQEVSKHREEGVAPDDLIPDHLQERSYWLWYTIVGIYTTANLTKESDKLIAVSAIAREVQPLMQSRYLAGLWESDLFKQLGWSESVRRGKSSMYCAPSWSWASTTSSVNLRPYHRSQDYYPLMEIINAHIDLDGGDEFGPVRAGYLDTLGQLFPTKFENHVPSKLEPESEVYGVGPFELDDEGYVIPRRFSTDMHEGPLYCMPLYMSSPRNHRALHFRSLVLQQRDFPNVYRRMGLVQGNIEDYPTTRNACPELLGNFQWPEGTEPIFTRNTTGITSIRLV